MIRVKGPAGDLPPSTGAGKGEITNFTARSRMRLLRQLACIDQGRVESGQFVTLTYPGTFCPIAAEWKVELDMFIKRLRREYSEAAGWWKLEPQKRGAPHFHLLLFGVPLDDDFKAWVSEAWYEVVGSGDLRHLRAGTRCERVRTWAGVMAYAGKYLGKRALVEDMPEGCRSVWQKVGRWWGSFGREHLPTAAVDLLLTQQQFDQIRAKMLDLQDADVAKRRAEMIERGVELPPRENWLRKKPDCGAASFMSFEEVAKLVKEVTGVDLATVETRPVKPGEFSC